MCGLWLESFSYDSGDHTYLLSPPSTWFAGDVAAVEKEGQEEERLSPKDTELMKGEEGDQKTDHELEDKQDTDQNVLSHDFSVMTSWECSL